MTAAFFALIVLNGISGKIQGIVKDEYTGTPIAAASVVITATRIGAATDDEGYFFILNVAPGAYTVEVSCIGYETQQIKNVIVRVDQTTRLSVSLKQVSIEMPPVTVTREAPPVEKDWTGTTYIVGKQEIMTLPIDFTTTMIQFQPSVAHTDTALHVRGGRETEVLYMIDNVSIIDPLTGEPAINVSKSVINEIIFMPGGFDAEYGRAMSGVVNIITAMPREKLAVEGMGKTEQMMPLYYDFGYENAQAAVHVPGFKKGGGIFSLDVMHTDDWNPKLYVLPHKQRDDYALYGKWHYAASGKLTMSVSGALSRSQLEPYYWDKWIFHPERYRSDLKKGNLQALNFNYLPDSRKFFNLTLSRLFTRCVYGVKIIRDYDLFEDYEFIDYHDIEYNFAAGSINNPFGVRWAYYPWDTDYPEYRTRTSEVIKVNANTHLQAHKYHEVKAGFEYAFQEFDNFMFYASNDTINPVVDVWTYHPEEYSLYVQDNIDYQGLYAKIGCRYDYFSSEVEGFKPKPGISPRVGFSFLVTEKFLFRANVGKYTQPPLYEHLYSYYQELPYTEYIWYYLQHTPMGNPDLGPEQTMSYEIGCQGALKKNLTVTFNVFNKDIKGLTGTRRIWYDMAHPYTSYFNVEFGNARGAEAILDYTNPVFNAKASYTLSWAQGTSSFATEAHELYIRDTAYIPPAEEYNLDFDQRHRFFVQSDFKFPLDTRMYLFAYFGQGFPYTPSGTEGKTQERNILRLEFQKQIDCTITKSVKIGSVSLGAVLEVINVLDIRYQLYPFHPGPFRWGPWEYDDYISIKEPYYRPEADLNHDGMICPKEEYFAQVAMFEYGLHEAWVNSFSSARRVRLGLSIGLQ